MTTPAVQPSFDDLGQPLSEVTFCVLDLETTGTRENDGITEIGAVKVQGGEIVAQFQTLVNPGQHIPALTTVITGITNSMVADAPGLGAVLPSFLQFCSGSVLVAHNARFDIGFLKRACVQLEYPWPDERVIDTLALARQALLRDEVPNLKLSTLAGHFQARTDPDHRALSDARATVDVLHGLLERVGNLGVDTLEDLVEFTTRVSPARRAKRIWAKDIPSAPGVYQFVADLRASDGSRKRQVLYVGKSRNLRRRVASYFTAAETRARMDEMIRIATGIEYTICRTPLEAEVLELRLIAAHRPRYNHRSRHPERHRWLKLTNEPFPRLSVVNEVRDDQSLHFGPLRGRSEAEQVTAALQEAFPIRQCTQRLSVRRTSPSCALADMGRCPAPCDLRLSPAEYRELIEGVKLSLVGDPSELIQRIGARIRALAEHERFEEAGIWAERLETFSRVAVRHQRIRSLSACPQLVAALRVADAWEIHVIRYGRLAGTAHAGLGENPVLVAQQATLLADQVSSPIPPAPAALIEETERIAGWLEQGGVRLVEVSGDWQWAIGVGPSASVRLRATVGTPDPKIVP